MKALKKILLAVVGIIVVLLIVALFVPREYTVERTIAINKPSQEVFEYIKLLKNQDTYSKWAKMDPDMKKTYTGIDGTIGFVAAWSSDKDDVGKGEQEIKNIENGKRIETEIRFLEPFASVAPSYMSTETIADNQTRVAWGFKGNMPYPFNLMRLFLNIEQMIGQDLDEGLQNLKVIMEK